MSTDRQLAANRANAQHSTGPRTIQGKAASSRNNTRHGLRSTTPVIPQLESPDEWERHRATAIEEALAELRRQLAPRGGHGRSVGGAGGGGNVAHGYAL